MAGQALTEEEEWRICTPGGEQQEGAMACGLALGRPEQHSSGLANRGLGAGLCPYTAVLPHGSVESVFHGKHSLQSSGKFCSRSLLSFLNYTVGKTFHISLDAFSKIYIKLGLHGEIFNMICFCHGQKLNTGKEYFGCELIFAVLEHIMRLTHWWPIATSDLQIKLQQLTNKNLSMTTATLLV